jgi:YVTN family beta-propeller protein
MTGGTLFVVDLSSGTVVKSVRVGRMPYGVAVSRDGARVYVANVLDGTLSVVDVSKIDTGSVTVDSIPAGKFPWGIVLSRDERLVYVSNVYGALVTVVDPAARKVVAQVPSDGGRPSGIALSPDGGRLYVTDFGGSRLWVVDVAKIGAPDAIINRVRVGRSPYAIAVNRDGTLAFVTNNASDTVSVVNVATPGSEFEVTEVPVGRSPHGVAMSSDGLLVYVVNHHSHSLSIIHSNTLSVQTIGLSDDDFPIAFGNFVVPARELRVQVDVKPGGNPNVINLKSRGTTPVAILGSPGYDVTQVDVASVRLAGAPVVRKPNGAYMESFDDVNGDGLIDLVLHFDTTQMQLSPGDTQVTLEGQMTDGTPFSGTDSVRVVP